MSDKQRWVYTQDGPELEKQARMTKLKVNKWYFIIPWILLFSLILYAFYSGDVFSGILLVIFGPMTVLYINIYTFRKLVIDPLKKQAEHNKPKIED